MPTTILQQRVSNIIEHHGSVRVAAAALKINYTYLYRLSTGANHNPSDAVLRKLKLRRVVTYVDIKEK